MNGVSHIGCMAIKSMLINNDSIVYLNLSQTRIHDADVAQIIPTLITNETLKTLNVSVYNIFYFRSCY